MRLNFRVTLHAKPGADAGHRLGRRDFNRSPRCMSLIQHMFIVNDGINPGKPPDGQETYPCVKLLPRLQGCRCDGEKARSKSKPIAKPVMIQTVFRLLAGISFFNWISHPTSSTQSASPSQPFSTRALMSEYAVAISLLSDATSVPVAGPSFTWRMDLPVPFNKRAGSGSAAP